MQTFLVTRDFDKSMTYLDNSRLNKNYLEGRQLLNIMVQKRKGETKGGFFQHPAGLMWDDDVYLFLEYLVANKRELDRRGIENDKNTKAIEEMAWWFEDDEYTIPWWYTDIVEFEKMTCAMRARLYKKPLAPGQSPDWYDGFRWDAEYYDEFHDDIVCCLPVVGPRGGVKKGCDYRFPTHIRSSHG